MQECSDDPLLVETVLGREGKDVDAAKLMIGRLTNRALDGGDASMSADCRSTLKRASLSLTD